MNFRIEGISNDGNSATLCAIHLLELQKLGLRLGIGIGLGSGLGKG